MPEATGQDNSFCPGGDDEDLSPRPVFGIERTKENGMSTPNEIRILRIVKERGSATRRAVAEAMGMSHDYSGLLLRVLVDRGFLQKDSGSFYITEKGIDELLAVLYHFQGQLQTRMNRTARQQKNVEKRIEELTASKASV